MAESSGQPLAIPVRRNFQFVAQQYVGLMLTVATLVAVLVAGYLWSQTPDYRVLYGNLSDRDGGAVIASLQQMNVPYKFADGGALMVPGNRVHEARVRLATQGLPKGGPVGFELMETQKFGTSQFAEQINYQRALEGELARTIQSMSAVQGARVHLALAKQSAFLREQPKPSASVLLNVSPGRTLDAAQVGAIVHLVSNSVPDLRASNVTIVDQNGNPLSSEQSNSARAALDPSQMKFRQDLEKIYSTRIEAILTPLTGPNNVRAQVTADLDFSETERAEEIYKPNGDPASAAVRSQQLSSALSSAAGGDGTGGVPGALSNQPAAAATAPITTPAAATGAANSANAANPGNSRKDSTVNYEVDKTVRHTRQEIGRIKRLAVAVVVNHRKQVSAAGKITYTPLKTAEITQITDLIKEVMAYDKDRGDTLSVMNSAFSVPEKEVIPEIPLWKHPDTIELAKTIGKNILIAGILLYIVLGVLRPLLKSYAAAAAAAPPPLAEFQATNNAQVAQLQSYEQQVTRAQEIARNDPKAVANVVKEWVAGNGK